MKSLRHINPLFWKYKTRIFSGFIFIVLSNFFMVYAPAIVGQGIDFLTNALLYAQQKNDSLEVPLLLQRIYPILGWDTAIPSQTSIHLSSWVIRMATSLAILYFLFYFIKGIFLFYQRQTIIVMSRHMEFDLKNEIYNHYQNQDTSFFKTNRTGDLMNRISEDVSRVRMYIGPAVMYTMNLIVLFVMCLYTMFHISPKLSLYTLLPMPFMMVGIFLVSRGINKRTEQVQADQSILSTTVQESMSGIRVLKGLHLENHFVSFFTHQSESYRNKQLRLVRMDSLFAPVIGLLVGISTMFTLYVGALEVQAGNISYGVIVQFVFYVNLLTWPFASVGWVTSLVMKAEASMTRILEFLNRKSRVTNGHMTISTIEKIQFNEVHFIYPETQVNAISNFNCTIHAGETAAFIGATGSGKSSIVQLLTRMYLTNQGRILINGIPMESIDENSFRDKIRAVPQDVFLFSDSILSNVKFGKPDATLQEVQAACKMADLHSTIMEFPDQYETMLGERGINLSGGQKQRLSIARALIGNPEILILDDCLSAVDTQTEERILEAIKEVRVGKTNIIVSHRISGIQHANQIHVIHEGTTIESGTHNELIERKGEYARLFQQQQVQPN
ncbi:MAG: ABC transporter ATP-binding protein [Bacteroidetes bacterium]|nr:ABC transporter ATP-binding protein [Bacteroidota bacterium]